MKMVGFFCVSMFFPRKSWRLHKLNTLGLFFPQNLGSISPNESHHWVDAKGTLRRHKDLQSHGAAIYNVNPPSYVMFVGL